MPSSPSLASPIRFGDFELDLRAGELRRAGARVPLAEQPLRLLEVLLEHPGLVVSREQLRERLWPADTFVDFEHGLNAAVKRLRDALGDAAETPRFIETVPKRGYRFVAPTKGSSGDGSGAHQRSALKPLAWALAGALVALLVTMIVGGRARLPEAPGPLTVTSVVVDQLVGQPGIPFAVSPDGRTVVFASYSDGLFRRDLDRVDPEPIEGTLGGSDVFFSEDGRSIGYETRSELWTTSLDGGTPQLLIPNHPLRGGTWGTGDRIVVGRVGSGLWMTSVADGEPRQLTVPAEGERHELPQMLPGGRVVLFTILSIKTPSRAAIFLLDTGETRHLFEGSAARFIGSGHVVFGLQGKLWAVAFDINSLQTRGPARPVRDDVRWSANGYPQFAIDGGLLAYVRTSPEPTNVGRRVLSLVSRQGKPEPLPLAPDHYTLPRLSPTGDRMVVLVGPTRDLWIYAAGRRTFTRLTSDRIVAFSAPAWTPDGSHVVFTTWFDGQVGLGWIRADGSGPVEPLVTSIGLRSFERTHP